MNFEAEQGSTPSSSNPSTVTPIDSYKVTAIKYPDNLGNDDLQHFVQFSINTRDKSQFRYDTVPGAVVNNTGSARIDPNVAGRAFDLALTGIISAGVTKSLGLGKLVKAAVSTGGFGQKVAKGLAAAGIGLGAAEGINQGVSAIRRNTDILKPNFMRRLSTVIALHMEERPSVRYSMEYSNKDLGVLAGLLGQSSTLTGAVSDLITSPEGRAAVAMTAARIPEIAGINARDLLRRSAGVTVNPWRETLFEQVDFRTFSFRYRFFPKDEAESRRVNRIINMFKEHMHPEISKERLFFIYPSEFEITYMFGLKENPFLFRFAPSALEDLQVDYGSGEGMSSFSNGAPTEINLLLKFRELEILTRERVVNTPTGGY
jgi:hypothetical protein